MARLTIASVLSTAQILLFTWLNGEKVGTDDAGNVYYKGKKLRAGRERRWVIYAGEAEASSVPPEWHGWLHHQTGALPAAGNPLRRSWQKPHMANPTGGDAPILPPGHALSAGRRPAATGDYEAWQPE